MGDKKQIDWPIERLIKVHKAVMKHNDSAENVLRFKIKTLKIRQERLIKIARQWRKECWETAQTVGYLLEERRKNQSCVKK